MISLNNFFYEKFTFLGGSSLDCLLEVVDDVVVSVEFVLIAVVVILFLFYSKSNYLILNQEFKDD